MIDAFDRDLAEEINHKYCAKPLLVPGGSFVRCGSRLKKDCPSCASIYANDWSAILRSGVANLDASQFQWVFFTLTAPSFGKVHRTIRGSRCPCGEDHSDSDTRSNGAAIDPSTYDYKRAAEWNYCMGRLWDGTRSMLRNHIQGIEYAVVREWQARGNLHIHGMLRIPIHEALPLTTISRLVGSTSTAWQGIDFSWGLQSDFQDFSPNETAIKRIVYLSKSLNYSLKDISEGPPSSARDHLRALRLASRMMSCERCANEPGRGLLCTQKCHLNYGARSSVVSVSRGGADKSRLGWSTTGLTRGAQREARIAWATGNNAPDTSGGLSAATVRAGRWAAGFSE